MSHDEYTVETITDSRIPGIRVRVVLDTDPHAPEFEAGYPIIRLNRGRTEIVYGDTADDLSDALRHFIYRQENDTGLDAIALFTQYVRVFHGGDVKVIRSETSREYGYLAYGTRKLAEGWGHTDPEKIDKYAREVETEEWQAYLDGEVYGVVTEQSIVVETITYGGLTGDEIRYEIDPSWDEIESCWGYYGQEYAVEAAREELDSHIPAEVV